MRIYWVLLLPGCRRQAAYRLALVSGLLTNGFFGIVRTAVFLALYHDRGLVAGLGFSDALTYTWLLPFGLTVDVPALTLLGRAGPPGLDASLLWMTPLAAAWTAALARIAWRQAIRHYVGAGS